MQGRYDGSLVSQDRQNDMRFVWAGFFNAGVLPHRVLDSATHE
jgi:hypothetical protein